MRMGHYFAAAGALAVPALLWTAWTGFARPGEAHVGFGLFTAVFAAMVHTLLILFMLVTGRVLKEAMASRPLPPSFLSELNEFFAKKKAYPIAILAASATAAAAVLGYAHRGFGTPTWIHWTAGLAAIGVNLWALPLEHRALRQNQKLIDRAAVELDRIDRERLGASGTAGEELATAAFDPLAAARWGLAVAAGSWVPYLYWALVVWRGEFSRVSVHPWIEGSALGLAVWWFARKEARTAR